jgi:DNA-binding PadR family transcriptional regulator
MRSPVSWALLGLLIERAGYGYDLVQRFERTYGDALELSTPSQIYAALAALERRSLIERLPRDGAPDALRQPKPHYQATAAGIESYQEWLVAQAHEERRGSRLFARQLAVLEPRAALAVIERYERACLREPARAPDDPSLGGASDLAGRLIDERERLAVGARLAWTEYARRELRAIMGARSPAR